MNTTYVDAGWLDSDDLSFASAPICSSRGWDADCNPLRIQYKQRDRVLSVVFAFVFVEQISDRLDAQGFRFGFRLSGRASEIRHVDEARL